MVDYYSSQVSEQVLIIGFKTAKENVVTGLIVKNTATVSTAGTHELSLLDVVNMDVILGISTTVVVKYNDANRRMLINPRDFSFWCIDNE